MNEETINVYELFNISEENARILSKKFEHLVIDNPDIRNLVQALNIDTGGQIAYLAYILGRHSEHMEKKYKIEQLIEGLIR